MRRSLLPSVSWLLLLLCAPGPGTRTVAAEERPEVGRYARVYKGGEGVTVVVLRIGPAEKNEALVQINGIDHPLDGVIRLHEVVFQGPGKYDYRTRAEGNTFTTLVQRNGLTELYVKGIPETVPVAYAEALSREVQPEHLLTAYLEQKSGAKR